MSFPPLRSVPASLRIAIALHLVLCSTDLAAQGDGSTRLRIGRDTVIAGVSCAPTGRAYAVVYASGALDECPLAHDSVIAGHRLPRETWVRLDEQRVLLSAWLPGNVVLQGVYCKGEGYKKWHTTFRPSGRLGSCYLSERQTFDGVTCLAGAFLTELSGTTQVSLHENGRLRSCRLAQTLTRDGRTVKHGARITLDPDGRVVPPPSRAARSR